MHLPVEALRQRFTIYYEHGMGQDTVTGKRRSQPV
jgi:hypothetical protein